ncbi:hypothetical protein NI443_004825 [Salmonella enterica]|nr:hypothetical protein [Salmonella enterica]HCJ1004099.1 hypothetical protein [Salmonella enterica]
MLSALLLAGSMLSVAGCNDTGKIEKEYTKIMGSQVVVVDVQKVYRESAVADKARAHQEQVRVSLQKGLEEIDAVYGTKGSHPSSQILQEGAQRLELQFKAEEQAANQVVAQVLATTTQAWSEEHPDKVVIARNLVLGAGKNADITGDILEKMKTVTPVFAEVPTVTVKAPQTDKKAVEPVSKKTRQSAASRKTGKDEKTARAVTH